MAGLAEREKSLEPGTLYVVATPIGNLEDLSFRALRVLKQADLIAAEDTRHTRKLCNNYAINTPLTSYYAHNEETKVDRIVEQLQSAKTVALVSDAGTPAISDPGYLLVKRCRDAGIPVVAIPGPSAVISALSISGLPSERFCFAGFLPAKSSLRRRFLEGLQEETQTVVCYESPRRLVKSLEIMQEVLGGERRVSVARELTKIHEEMISGTIPELIGHYKEKGVRGEIVILISPAAQKVQKESVDEALIRVRDETGLPMKQVVKQVARQFGLPGSDVYKISLKLNDMEGQE